MKVYIGPYKNWIGPYHIAAKILFWMDKDEDERVHKFGKWLADDKNGNDSWLTNLCNWIDKKKKRKVKIRIDKYDTWNMDHTLALIALPMLKQLKECKHGSPYTDDEDVPEHLRSTAATPRTQEEIDTGHVDDLHFKRWDWVMGEMIYAFEMELDEDWDMNIYNNGGWTDENRAKRDVIAKRIENGFRLFGKYYQALWD